MEQLIQRIEDVLKSRKIQFRQLAEHLGYEEDSLRTAFQNNSIEIRTLEKIAKELKIPLYRFFRDPVGNLLESVQENQAYAMITHEELLNLRLQLQVAQKEIELLKKELSERSNVIEKNKTKQ